MFTLENLLIILFITLVLFHIRPIIGFIMLLLHQYQEPVVSIIDKESIDEEINESTKPYEELLISQGFVYQCSFKATNIQVGLDLDHHIHYYYHPQNSVHAFVNTDPNKGSLQSVVIEYTTFYESHNICTTYDCFVHSFASDPKDFYFFDHYHGSFEKSYNSHLKDRQIESESIIKQSLTPQGCQDYSNYVIEKIMQSYVNNNIMHTRKNNKYSFTPSLVLFQFAKRFLNGYDKGLKALKLADSKEKTVRQKNEKHTLARQLETNYKKPERKNKFQWFLISLLVFVLLFGVLGIELQILVIIVVILFIHEMGHFLAMRYFNYNDTSIFFIPLFGAATTGFKEKTVPFEEFIILLAGPLPGIIIGFVIFMTSSPQQPPFLLEYALFSIIINYINLLPIFPLDGGRVVQGLLLSRYPRGQFYFYLASLVFIGISAFLMQNIFLAFFAILLLFILKQNYLISTLLQTMFKEQASSSSKERVIKLLTENSKYKNESLADKSNLAQQTLKIIHNEKPTLVMSLFGLSFYLLFLFAPFIAMFFMIFFI